MKVVYWIKRSINLYRIAWLIFLYQKAAQWFSMTGIVIGAISSSMEVGTDCRSSCNVNLGLPPARGSSTLNWLTARFARTWNLSSVDGNDIAIQVWWGTRKRRFPRMTRLRCDRAVPRLSRCRDGGSKGLGNLPLPQLQAPRQCH